MDSPYGEFGRPVALLEAYKEWREIQEADSKADFAQFLWGPIAYSMWQGYDKIDSQWDRYVRIESMRDFRERQLHGLNALKGFGYVGDHGEYPGMTRSARGGPGLIIDTYGGVYAITRQAIINDDSGDLLNRNPSDMGYAAGLFVTETLIALIESNPTAYDGNPFFSSGSHSNAGTAALSEDSIVDAVSAMENQRDDDNRRIMVRVAALVVPNARLELIAKRISRSQETGTTVNWTGAAGVGAAVMDKGTANVVADIIPTVIREPFLSDQTDWYLFANPDTVPAFAIGFLNGKREPFVGLKDPQVRNALGAGMDPYTYELDSVDFKVRHDFGCAAVDWRGAYKATVAG